jgi:hypothetical protein
LKGVIGGALRAQKKVESCGGKGATSPSRTGKGRAAPH